VGAKGKGGGVQSRDDVLKAGDVIWVAPKDYGQAQQHHLVVDTALFSSRRRSTAPWGCHGPHTGRVLAVVGGFAYSGSQFDRACRASAAGFVFKPIVYAAALDNGLQADRPGARRADRDRPGSRQDMDPEETTKADLGLLRRRFGPAVEKSRNLMTVARTGDGLPEGRGVRQRSASTTKRSACLTVLGSGEVTLLAVCGYATLNNGGKQVTPTLIDRIQDAGVAHSGVMTRQRVQGLQRGEMTGQVEPSSSTTQADHHAATPIRSLDLEGVSSAALRECYQARLANVRSGKTGTTNEERTLGSWLHADLLVA